MAAGAAGWASAAVGGASLIQGGKQSREANKQADEAAKNVERQTAEQLALNQGFLDEWEASFGGLEDNLNDYYSNLDPAKFAAEGKGQLNEAIDKNLGQLNESLASQGLQSSGMKAQAEKEAAFAKATGGAAIDFGSEEKVAGMQADWLGNNRAQQTNARSGMNNAYGKSISSNYEAQQNQANQRGKSGQGYMDAGGNLIGGAIKLGLGNGTSNTGGDAPVWDDNSWADPDNGNWN